MTYLFVFEGEPVREQFHFYAKKILESKGIETRFFGWTERHVRIHDEEFISISINWTGMKGKKVDQIYYEPSIQLTHPGWQALLPLAMCDMSVVAPMPTIIEKENKNAQGNKENRTQDQNRR